MNFKNLFTKNGLLNVLAIAAPIVAGVISGGVFTAPVLVTALGVLVAKLAPSLKDDATYIKNARLDKAEQATRNGQISDPEDPE